MRTALINLNTTSAPFGGTLPHFANQPEENVIGIYGSARNSVNFINSINLVEGGKLFTPTPRLRSARHYAFANLFNLGSHSY